MRIGQVFANAIVRRVAFVLVALVLSWIGIGRAEAGCTAASCTDQQSAFQAATAEAVQKSAQFDAKWLVSGPVGTTNGPTQASPYYDVGRVIEGYGAPRGGYYPTAWQFFNSGGGRYAFPWSAVCAGGMNYEAGECNPSPAECLAKNDSLGSSIAISDTDTQGCSAGCAMSMGTDYQTSSFSSGGITRTLFQGKMRFTGAVCSTPSTKAPDNPAPACDQIDGMTVCKRDDGKLCYSIPGKPATSHCWAPGETGEKTDGANKQITAAGPTPAPTPPPLPSGDSFIPNGSPITSTTTTGPGATSPKTTTTNNFTTNFGTNAGPTSTGTPTGGTGGPGEGDGEGEGDGDGETATGAGGTCAAPPVCSKPGSVACGTLTEAWAARCKGPDLTGGGTCEAAPTCSGNKADCLGLATLWYMRCEALSGSEVATMAELATQNSDNLGYINEGWDRVFDGEEGTWVDADDPFEGARQVQDENWLLSKLDPSGFFGTAGECPALPPLSVGGISLPISIEKICELLSQLSALVMALAYFRAFKIMAA